MSVISCKMWLAPAKRRFPAAVSHLIAGRAPLLRGDAQYRVILDQAEAARESTACRPEVGLDRGALDTVYHQAHERLTAGLGSAPR
jgi:hypothetical protein